MIPSVQSRYLLATLAVFAVEVGCASAPSQQEDANANAPSTKDDRGNVASTVADDEGAATNDEVVAPDVSGTNDEAADSDVATTTAAATQSQYPCNGSTAGYDALAIKTGSTWKVTRSGKTVYSGSDMAAALSAAMNSLTANRTTKQSVLVQGSGDYPASTRFTIPSYTVLNVCGTINVTGTASGDYAPIYSRDRKNIEIPNVKITGTPNYGMFFRNVSGLKLGNLDLRHTTGIGVRVDNNAGSVKVTDLSIDYVYGSGMKSHVVETYGVDRVTIGTVEGKNVGECGLLLNNTTNANVSLVSCEDCGKGTGYAAFRIANDAGKIGNDWPAGNIHVGKVYARGGGRGIFSVSGSGGLTIDEIDVADTGNNPILLQNCINTTIAAKSGKISRGAVVLSNDTTNTNSGKFEPSRNVNLKNLVLSNGATVSEAWCQLGDRKNRATNITGGTVKMCFK
jgi:hypothetical protein